MRRSSVVWTAALAAAALYAGRGEAITVTVTLDVYYGDSNGDNVPDTAAAGSWQLVARTSLNDNRGIAGLDTALVGVVNSVGAAGSTFRAPNGAATGGEAGFPTTFDAKSWAQDQDGSAATLDMLFGQVPLASPGPQRLFYDIGQPKIPSVKASNDQANGQPVVPGLTSVVTWNYDDPLGDYLVDGDQTDGDGAFQRGVLLAQGRFTAGASPGFAPSGTAANVFTALGTQTLPPGVGTIQGATIATETRSNLFTFAGDANLDHDVDASQPGGGGDGQIVLANRDRTGNVLWQEGDFNGDKDCDFFQDDGQGDAQILTAALGLGGVPPAGALLAPAAVTAIYNSATGELIVEIGAGVGVLGFQSAGLFNLGANPGQNLPSIPLQFTSSVLSFFNGGVPLPTGLFSLGLVLPPGLSQEQIHFGFTGVGMASEQAPVAVVPEPGTAAVMALAAVIGAVCVRRRR